MGHRSWFTGINSKHELLELLEAIDRNKFKNLMGSCSLAYYLRPEESPVFDSLGVIAWDSSGDWAIKGLPHFLRQQTKLLEQVQKNFPDFLDPRDHGKVTEAARHHRESVLDWLSPEAYAEIVGAKREEIPELLTRHAEELFSEGRHIELGAISFSQLIEDEIHLLPEYHLVDDAKWTNEAFLEKLYYDKFTDPGSLEKANIGVFLSHSSKDKHMVRYFRERLEGYGINCWLDEAEISYGESLIWKISKALDDVDYIAVFISDNSIESDWVRYELDKANEIERTEQSFRIVPIVLGDCELPQSVSDRRCIFQTQGTDLWVKQFVQDVFPSGLFTEVIGDVMRKRGLQDDVKVNFSLDLFGPDRNDIESHTNNPRSDAEVDEIKEEIKEAIARLMHKQYF